LEVFLNAQNSGLSSITSYFKNQKPNPESKSSSSLISFTGLLNASRVCLYEILFIYTILMPIALLICLENSFWSRKGGEFVELFKKSFKLYVKSGTRKKVEAAVNILINEEGGCLTTEDFNAKFYMIISEHFLCKIHCFYLHLTHLTAFTEIQPTQKRKRKSLLSCKGGS
jgi:hypothetical protein